MTFSKVLILFLRPTRIQLNSIQVYLYSAFYDTIVASALQEIKFLQYIYTL